MAVDPVTSAPVPNALIRVMDAEGTIEYATQDIEGNARLVFTDHRGQYPQFRIAESVPAATLSSPPYAQHVVPPEALQGASEAADRAEGAAVRAEAVVADLDAEVESVVLSHPDLQGPPGVGVESITDEDGDGIATVRLTSGAVSDLPLPRGLKGDQGLKGDKGDKGDTGATGPANALTIGTVTGGATAGATITGEAPAQTLSLVLPQGATGDRGPIGPQGPPGVVSSASAYVIIGPGRPDQPSTTAGTITGSEPVGAEYRSMDGANVGAWVWMRRPGGRWEVTVGDTGWRKLDTAGVMTASHPGGMVALRRINNQVTFSIADMRNTSGASFNSTWVVRSSPVGFRPPAVVSAPFILGEGPAVTRVLIAHAALAGTGFVRINSLAVNEQINGYIIAQTAEPWPSAPLPGTAT